MCVHTLLIMNFCARKTFSRGISMPRSPRATMMPSVYTYVYIHVSTQI